jgi:hypothetical protein
MAERKTTAEKPVVFEVYDLLRTAMLNVEYFTIKLEDAQRKQFLLQVFLAIVVPSSGAAGGVAGLKVWNTPYGGYVWGALALIATILAVAQPFLKLTEAIQAYESSVSWFRAVQGQLSELRGEIAWRKTYDERMRDQFLYISRIFTRAKDLGPSEKEDKELIQEIYSRIEREMPDESFYVPPGEPGEVERG